jgi:hypothetical protein
MWVRANGAYELDYLGDPERSKRSKQLTRDLSARLLHGREPGERSAVRLSVSDAEPRERRREHGRESAGLGGCRQTACVALFALSVVVLRQLASV